MVNLNGHKKMEKKNTLDICENAITLNNKKIVVGIEQSQAENLLQEETDHVHDNFIYIKNTQFANVEFTMNLQFKNNKFHKLWLAPTFNEYRKVNTEKYLDPFDATEYTLPSFIENCTRKFGNPVIFRDEYSRKKRIKQYLFNAGELEIICSLTKDNDGFSVVVVGAEN